MHPEIGVQMGPDLPRPGHVAARHAAAMARAVHGRHGISPSKAPAVAIMRQIDMLSSKRKAPIVPFSSQTSADPLGSTRRLRSLPSSSNPPPWTPQTSPGGEVRGKSRLQDFLTSGDSLLVTFFGYVFSVPSRIRIWASFVIPKWHWKSQFGYQFGNALVQVLAQK